MPIERIGLTGNMYLAKSQVACWQRRITVDLYAFKAAPNESPTAMEQFDRLLF